MRLQRMAVLTDLGSAVEIAAEQIRRGKESENLAAEDENETTGE